MRVTQQSSTNKPVAFEFPIYKVGYVGYLLVNRVPRISPFGIGEGKPWGRRLFIRGKVVCSWLREQVSEEFDLQLR